MYQSIYVLIEILVLIFAHLDAVTHRRSYFMRLIRLKNKIACYQRVIIDSLFKKLHFIRKNYCVFV